MSVSISIGKEDKLEMKNKINDPSAQGALKHAEGRVREAAESVGNGRIAKEVSLCGADTRVRSAGTLPGGFAAWQRPREPPGKVRPRQTSESAPGRLNPCTNSA